MHAEVIERRRLYCADLMDQLNECHKQGFIKQSIGACNDLSAAVNQCFRAERNDRQKEHYDRAKERRKKFDSKLKEMEEEEYGPNGYLREVERIMQQEAAQKAEH